MYECHRAVCHGGSGKGNGEAGELRAVVVYLKTLSPRRAEPGEEAGQDEPRGRRRIPRLHPYAAPPS
ncbi:MAG: hypothetical protein HY575_07100 [candidate division NC10 bacterium]|nr:hypothetical protein [candidate division NC10 bacterium]